MAQLPQKNHARQLGTHTRQWSKQKSPHNTPAKTNFYKPKEKTATSPNLYEQTTTRPKSKRTYADVTRCKPQQPSTIFKHLHPKKKDQHRSFRVPGEKLPDSFWNDSTITQQKWQCGQSRPSLVQWILQARTRQWQSMVSGSWQQKMLKGETALNVQGVIYALVFAKQRLLYIGQTVNSAWHRWQQHMHARWKDDTEALLQQRLQRRFCC